MIKLLLTESELAEIAEALDDPEFKERFGRRLMAVRMHGLGVANFKIAGILRVSDDTVTNYLKIHRDRLSIEKPQVNHPFRIHPFRSSESVARRLTLSTSLKCPRERIVPLAFHLPGRTFAMPLHALSRSR